LSADTPSLPKTWYDAQKELLIWIIGRIWPNRYPLLESAFQNYKAVLQDLLNVFDQHVDYRHEKAETIRTKKFYQINEWNPERYEKLSKQYDDHENLVNDLFFELTRAANYICDRVRETMYESYRIVEGVVLIERHSVGPDLKTVHVRLEYRGDERTAMPYPGLKEFKKARYTTRDYALNPNYPDFPEADEGG
jgi:hypothetical protein